jgi:hypothetical protein
MFIRVAQQNSRVVNVVIPLQDSLKGSRGIEFLLGGLHGGAWTASPTEPTLTKMHIYLPPKNKQLSATFSTTRLTTMHTCLDQASQQKHNLH